MRLLFSAINCTLDTSNGASISVRTFLRFLARAGVDCRSLSASVYDKPGDGDAAANLRAGGALPVEEPGLPQTLWLNVDESVQHYVVETQALNYRDLAIAEEQVLFNRALAMLDEFQPDVLLLYGNRRYERSLLKKARERGITTVFYLVNPGYKDINHFVHVDLIFTDTEATRSLFAARFADFNPRVIGKFIEVPIAPPLVHPEYVTFINPSPEKGVTLFLRIAELAHKTLPQAKFLVVESRSVLETAQRRTGLGPERTPNILKVGLQHDMGAVFGSTKILLAPSLWHDSGPRVAVEALAFGIPSVVSNRGGLPELVGDGGIVIDPPAPLVESHWLVPPLADAIPWVESLRLLLTNPAAYQSYRAAALAQWRSHDPALRLPGIIADLEKAVATTRARAGL